MKKKNRDYKTMTDSELEKELDLIDREYQRRRAKIEVVRAKNLTIGGFTVKDVAVRYDGNFSYDDGDVMFSFYLKKDGKLYDFYYGKSDGGAGDWWPEAEDNCGMSPIHEFIPEGFGEACENYYEYHGTTEEAIEQLKEHGITDIEKGDW